MRLFVSKFLVICTLYNCYYVQATIEHDLVDLANALQQLKKQFIKQEIDIVHITPEQEIKVEIIKKLGQEIYKEHNKEKNIRLLKEMNQTIDSFYEHLEPLKHSLDVIKLKNLFLIAQDYQSSDNPQDSPNNSEALQMYKETCLFFMQFNQNNFETKSAIFIRTMYDETPLKIIEETLRFMTFLKKDSSFFPESNLSFDQKNEVDRIINNVIDFLQKNEYQVKIEDIPDIESLNMLKNDYKTLGIDENATSDAAKKAYKKLIRQWHPDKNPGNKDAIEKTKEITAAYERIIKHLEEQNTDKEYFISKIKK